MVKKLLCLVVLIALFINAIFPLFSVAMENDTKIVYINNITDLKNFALLVNNGNSFSGYTIELNADIELKSAYAKDLKNEKFQKLVNTLKVKDNIAYKYVTKLEQTVDDLNNCHNCKGLAGCKNKVTGMVYYPKLIDERLEFNYVACKYLKKQIAENEEVKSEFYKMPYEIERARMSEIEVDKTRSNVLKWIKKF